MQEDPHDDPHDLRQYALHGDEAAFCRVVERHAAMVHGVALRMTQDRTLAEEITQTVFSILAGKVLFVSHAGIGSWLHGVTAAECRNARRKETRRLRLLNEYSEMMTANQPSPNGSGPWSEVRPHLDEAIGRLPAEDREIMILRFFEQRSFREISTATQRTEEACRQKCRRALERLEKILTRKRVLPAGTALAALLAAEILCAPPSSAAAIATTAVRLGPATGGALWPKTLLYMTTQNLLKTAAIAVVLVAIPTVLYLKPEPLPRLAATGGAALSGSGGAAQAGKGGAKPGKPEQAALDWKAIAHRFADADRSGLTGMVAARKLQAQLKELSAAELTSGLEEVTESDIDEGAKGNLRYMMTHLLAPLDPMAVLDRFPQDSKRNMSVELVPGLQELAKRDLPAADAWLQEQMKQGRFDKDAPKDSNAARQLEYYQGAVLGAARTADPADYGKRILALPPDQRGGAIEWSVDRDFSKAADTIRQGGDPAVLGALLDSSFAESAILMNNTNGKSNDAIYSLLKQLPDSADTARIREKLSSFATQSYKVERQ